MLTRVLKVKFGAIVVIFTAAGLMALGLLQCSQDTASSTPTNATGNTSKSTPSNVAKNTPKRTSPNVILISIDTLRADHLGCYHYPVPTTPFIDAFAKHAVLFENTIAQAPSTEPSHASIFTSLLVSHHGAYFSRKVALDENAITIAEILKERGYRTISYNGGGQIDATWGFDQGFDEYHSFVEIEKPGQFQTTVDRSLKWFDDNGTKQPTFMFLHTFETHHPYTPAPESLKAIGHKYSGNLPNIIAVELLEQINKKELAITKTDHAHIVATYDAEIRSIDAGFGSLVTGLIERGLYDNTIIIFTSDHGEEFGEHGKMGWHSHSLWDELLRVPLLIKFADQQMGGTRVKSQVRSIDILPTVVDTLAIKPLDVFEGETLIPLAKGRSSINRPAVSQKDSKHRRPPVSLRTVDWKYVEISRHTPWLIDLQKDPEEKVNTFKTNPTQAKKMTTHLNTLLLARDDPKVQQKKKMKSTLKKQLEALGYMED